MSILTFIQALLQTLVEPVPDMVRRTIRQAPRNHCPASAKLKEIRNDYFVFRLSPFGLANHRAELVCPPITELNWGSIRKFLMDEAPLFPLVERCKIDKLLIVFS